MAGHLVQIATAFNVSEAIVLQSKLRAYGVPSHIFDLGTANVDPGLVLAIGGMRLMVNAEDAEFARELVWMDEERAIPRRPYSDNTATNALWAIILSLMGVPAPARISLHDPRDD